LPTFCFGSGWKLGLLVKQPRRALHVSCKQGSEFEAHTIKKDDDVQVLFDGMWHDSKILTLSNGGTICKVMYKDGGEEENVNIAHRVRPIPSPTVVQEGDMMQVLWDDVWHDCEIQSVSDKGDTCTVQYMDGGDEEENVDIAERIRTPRIKIDSLRVGQKFRGEVKIIKKYGAFVDIGAEKLGMVHKGRIAREKVKDVQDYVVIGQIVDVWVSRIADDGTLGLSMVEVLIGSGGGRNAPVDLSAFEKTCWYNSQKWLAGEVVSTSRYFLRVLVEPPDGSAPQSGLVHISQLRKRRTEIRDQFIAGDRVKVRVLKLNHREGILELSMRSPASSAG